MSGLTPAQLEQLKQQLQDRNQVLRDDIRRELAQAGNESYSAIAGQVHDRGEEAVADLLSDVNNAVINHQFRELRAIEEALRRMQDGGYNQCDSCGETIGLARLQSWPAAIRCLACQERYEKTHPEDNRSGL